MPQPQEIAPGVARLPVSIANVYFVGEPGGPWALVDTGVPNSAAKIQAAAEERYGRGAVPAGILLTHGHLDHAGSAADLADAWNVPVYAHRLDLPFLTGKAVYPPGDPTVGGAMAFLTRFFPPTGIDLGASVRALPPDGALPFLPGWEWHFTPGHAPGHVCFWRASDRTLLAGDALATVNLNSLFELVAQKTELHGPPAAITCDWGKARTSVGRLAGLRPIVIACGHGRPMSGPAVAAALSALAADFPVPAHGRYLSQPAVTDETGIVSLPPPAPDPLPVRLAIGVILAGVVLAATKRRRK